MKKESKAKSVVIAVIAIILALCAVGAVVGVGSNGFENWDPSSWFKPDDTEDPITSDDDKPKVNTYDDITTVINGLSLNMTDDGVHASSQTVANSNGGTDTWHYYTFSLDDKGLYTGSTEYNHDYNLYASFNDNDYVAFKSVSSDNAQELLAYNSAIWGEKCIYHNSYAVSGTVCHFYVYSCRIDDVCAYLNGDTSVCHPKDNVLTIGISTVDYELESFVVDEFSRIEAVNLLNNEVILKTMLINDDESIMLNEINYALDITEGTTYRIYVNIDGLEVVKEINCVCTSSDNIGFENGPAVTLGSMGEYACFLIYDDNEEKGAIIGFANNATCEIINEEGLNTLRKDNNGFFWCMYYGMAINNVTVHAVTLASDPLLSF